MKRISCKEEKSDIDDDFVMFRSRLWLNSKRDISHYRIAKNALVTSSIGCGRV